MRAAYQALIETGSEGTTTSRPGFAREEFQGLKGLAHTRFGGPGEDNPPKQKARGLAAGLFSLNPEPAF